MQKISDILWAMLYNSWKCIFNCVTWFLILFNKIEKYFYIPFVYQGSQEDRHSEIVALVASQVQNSSLSSQNSSLIVGCITNFYTKYTLKNKI